VAPNKDKDKFKSLVTGIFTKEELREFRLKIRKSKFNQLKSFKDNLAANLREDKVIKRKRLSCNLLKKYLTFIKSEIQAQVSQEITHNINEKLNFYLKSNKFEKFNFT
jgi:tRNA U34 5-carboxymethylaminomethyl modifying enzyme MnmG/GidA